MSGNDQVMLMLGEIKGELTGIRSAVDKQGVKIDGIDDRLRNVETQAARNGMVAGGVSGLGIMLIAEAVKAAVFNNHGA
ncbi:MAG: hypothetical protein HY272_01785 [Gammaproteobacteria bacterium]|nr:hypothetical protein [Gammaproteobacteria bacterium]